MFSLLIATTLLVSQGSETSDPQQKTHEHSKQQHRQQPQQKSERKRQRQDGFKWNIGQWDKSKWQ